MLSLYCQQPSVHPCLKEKTLRCSVRSSSWDSSKNQTEVRVLTGLTVEMELIAFLQLRKSRSSWMNRQRQLHS
jgi:hypothetical protein